MGDQNNPGCELVAGNQCPTVCGGTWKEWRSGWELAPSMSVTCKVNTDHCNNNVKDSDETDVDCGGVSCDACKNGVDGGWGEWSQWSKCNAKCPKTGGKQERTRNCDNPAQSNGGKDCAGQNKEEKNCKIKCSTSPCKETCSKKKKCSSCKKNKCKSKKVQNRCPVTCNRCKSSGSGGNKPCKDKSKNCKKQKKRCKKSKMSKRIVPRRVRSARNKQRIINIF